MLGRSRFRSRARFLQSRALPTLSLDFLAGEPLDSRITFTRSTTATFVGSNGLLQTAAINAPRFDYNPLTLAPLGLLIEEQRINSALYSEQFDNAIWGKANLSVSANTSSAPNGATAADKLIPNTTNTDHLISQDIGTVSSGSVYVFSVYVKADGYNFIRLSFGNVAGGGFTFFNLSTGAIGATSGMLSNVIESVGNGWFRCTVVRAAASNNVLSGDVYVQSANNQFGWAGNGTDGVLAWGGQIEAGSFATSYIPTVASTVTRAADIAVMTGTNFSSWYNASEGTFVASFEASPNTYTTYVAASNGVVAQNSVHIDNDIGGNMRAPYYSGSSNVALLSLGAIGALNAVNKVATAYRVNDFAASRNGAAAVTDTAGAVPSGVDRLNIGADPSGAAVNVSNTHIRTITYYPSRLSNTQLQALSV